MTCKLSERQLRLLRRVKKAQLRPMYVALGGPDDTSGRVFHEWGSYATCAYSIEATIAERLCARGYLQRASAWPVFRTKRPLWRLRLGWIENKRVHVRPHLGLGGKWWLTEKGMGAVNGADG